jgi:hypothetical protein
MNKSRNLTSVVFLAIPLLLTGIFYEELKIWGYYGPIDFPWKWFGNMLVLAMLALITFLLIKVPKPRDSEKLRKGVNLHKVLPVVSIIFLALAVFQYFWILGTR